MSDAVDDDLEQAAEDIEEADISKTQRFSATSYLIALFITIGVSIVAAVWFDYIQLHIDATATVQVGWIVEYLVAGIAAAFLLFTAAMVLVALPVSISAAIIRFAAGIADSGPDD